MSRGYAHPETPPNVTLVEPLANNSGYIPNLVQPNRQPPETLPPVSNAKGQPQLPTGSGATGGSTTHGYDFCVAVSPGGALCAARLPNR